MIIKIGILLYLILSVIIYFLMKKYTKYLFIEKIIYSLSLGFVLSLFFTIAILIGNNNNKNFLFQYVDFEDIELIDYKKAKINVGDNISCNERYEFFLIYSNGKKLRGVLDIEDDIPFKQRGNYTFYLDNKYGDAVYSVFWNKDVEKGIELRKTIIDDNFTPDALKDFSQMPEGTRLLKNK